MKQTNSRLALSIALFCAVQLSPPSLATAQNACETLESNTSYQDLVAEGVAALKAGSYDAAFKHFTSAQQVCPFDPGVTYYMARTKHLAGECAVAVLLYDQTVAHLNAGMVPSQLPMETITERRGEAQACADAPNESTLSVRCADEGVTLVFGDGKEAGCPYDGAVLAGAHDITARLSGHEAQAMTVDVPEGGTKEVMVSALRPLEAPQTVSSAPDGAAAAESPAVVETPLPNGFDAPAKANEGSSAVGWVVGGIGLAVVGTGAALLAVAEGERADVAGADRATRDGYVVVTGYSQAEAEDKLAQADTLGLAGWVALGVGGAALATGVVLLLTSDGEEADSSVSAGWWGSGGAVLWTQRF